MQTRSMLPTTASLLEYPEQTAAGYRPHSEFLCNHDVRAHMMG